MQDWIEQTITISLDGPPHHAQVQAIVVGHLALHHSHTHDYWCVTHVPTGGLIWWEFDRDVAKHALMIFLASPIDWSHTDKAVYRRYGSLFKVAVALHRRWRRHRAFRWNLRFIGRHRRRNRADIKRVHAYRTLVRDRTIARYLLPTMTDAALDLSDGYRFSRGPRRLWKPRLGRGPWWEVL